MLPDTTRSGRILAVLVAIAESPRCALGRILLASAVGALALTTLAVLSTGHVFLQTVHTQKHVAVFSWKRGIFKFTETAHSLL